MKKYQTHVDISEVLDEGDNDVGGAIMVTNEVAIPYVDPTPKNEDSSSDTTTANVHFINIAKENKKGVALGTIVAIIYIIMHYWVCLSVRPSV